MQVLLWKRDWQCVADGAVDASSANSVKEKRKKFAYYPEIFV